MAQYKGEVFVDLFTTASIGPATELQFKLGVIGGYHTGDEQRTIRLGRKQLEAHYLAVHRLLYPGAAPPIMNEESYDNAHAALLILIDEEGYQEDSVPHDRRLLELVIAEYDTAHYTLEKEQHR